MAWPGPRLHGSTASGSAAAPVSEAPLADRGCAGDHDAAPEQCTAIDQAVAGHDFRFV